MTSGWLPWRLPIYSQQALTCPQDAVVAHTEKRGCAHVCVWRWVYGLEMCVCVCQSGDWGSHTTNCFCVKDKVFVSSNRLRTAGGSTVSVCEENLWCQMVRPNVRLKRVTEISIFYRNFYFYLEVWISRVMNWSCITCPLLHCSTRHLSLLLLQTRTVLRKWTCEGVDQPLRVWGVCVVLVWLYSWGQSVLVGTFCSMRCSFKDQFSLWSSD